MYLSPISPLYSVLFWAIYHSRMTQRLFGIDSCLIFTRVLFLGNRASSTTSPPETGQTPPKKGEPRFRRRLLILSHQMQMTVWITVNLMKTKFAKIQQIPPTSAIKWRTFVSSEILAKLREFSDVYCLRFSEMSRSLATKCRESSQFWTQYRANFCLPQENVRFCLKKIGPQQAKIRVH